MTIDDLKLQETPEGWPLKIFEVIVTRWQNSERKTFI